MDQVTLRNFRCFRKKQTARLAPLTLLVGENSTGKTSFMAMIRALWGVANEQPMPDFKEDPYDLGSFDEIAHYRGGRGGRADSFEAGFNLVPRAVRGQKRHHSNSQPYSFEVRFKKRGTVPGPVQMRLSNEKVWVKMSLEDPDWQISYGTGKRSWRLPDTLPGHLEFHFSPIFIGLSFLRSKGGNQSSLQGVGKPTKKDWQLIRQLVDSYSGPNLGLLEEQVYASAPVRSKPHRTYDPARTTRDPEGDYVPMYLAEVYSQNKERWNVLKTALENFGRASGLFDEISVKPLGNNESGPFQVQIRKFGKRAKGPRRNLIDVGYGVSQVLPVITELLRPDAPTMFLLQQPEVHLHPSAQAALGSLFCQIAEQDRQMIVETHSDHLLDRVRMDVRDGTTQLRPEDVSILYFERGDLDVCIHSLRVNQEGNILDAPNSYRKFFLQETRRSLGL